MQYDIKAGMVLSTVHEGVNMTINAMYECENKRELIQYLHAALCSHPKSTLMAAAKAGYLHGFPGLTAEAIGKYVKIEEATEAGHMRATPKGKQSTTKKSTRGRPRTKKRDQEIQERVEAMNDAMMIPQQQPDNKKIKLVYMTVKLAEGWIASDQTGRFPRVSSRGNEYIAVFYVYDPNFIKGVPIKSRNKENMLDSYKHIYKYCEERGFKPILHRMDNETS